MKLTLTFLLGSFLTEVTFGWTYHYSTTTMNWTAAREWCQERHTDMVVIQNQDENNYLVNKLPIKKKYYWIGITKQHKNETWTWIGNNSTWIGNESWAANEPNNDHSTEFCVEIYVNNDANRGKWNDEKCANKKYAACYKAQCNETSCDRGRCQETTENITCLCEPGYEGGKCQRASNPERSMRSEGIGCSAVECPPLAQPDNGHLSCSNGNMTFNSTCRFKCYSGFLMIGSPAVTCGLTGVWSGPRPTCARQTASSQKRNFSLTVECPPLAQPDNGHLSCSNGNMTFNSTCRFKCYSGFLMIGSPAVTCGLTGVWSGPRPTCTSYKKALLAVTGCGALSALCCICMCWMKHRKRKKLSQARQPEEFSSPTSEALG